jgi:hypothetical protein
MLGNPGAATNLLSLPIGIVLLGIAILGFVVGIAWVSRITPGPEDGDDWWRFRGR